MKILRIAGENIASLADRFEVDFTKEPLASAGLFAITGKTGAGKSTVLDTMCLALFGTTPRLKARSEVVTVQQEGAKRIAHSDPRLLLRRGAWQGFAEVDFRGIDGCDYRARWSVRRAGKRADGNLQGDSLILTDLASDAVLSDKKSESLRSITRLLGLTFEQFTRSVLLAQGDFAKFLHAPDKEKAEILEKLTGTRLFSTVSAAIYARAEQERKEYQLAQAAAEAIPVMAPERLLEIQQALAAILTTPLSRRCDALRRHLQYTERAAELSRREASAREELDEARAAYEASTRRRQLLEQLKRVAEVAPLFAIMEAKSLAIREAKEKHAEVEKQLQESLATLGRYHRQVRQFVMQADAYEEQIRKRLQDRHHLKPLAESFPLIDDLRRNCLRIRKDQVNRQKKLETDSGRLEKLARELEALRAELEELERTAPSEVIRLRQGLVEGEPCPVCGSRHHVSVAYSDPSKELSEAEIEQQKRVLRQRIEAQQGEQTQLHEGLLCLCESLRASEDEYTRQARQLRELVGGLPAPPSSPLDDLWYNELERQIGELRKDEEELAQASAIRQDLHHQLSEGERQYVTLLPPREEEQAPEPPRLITHRELYTLSRQITTSVEQIRETKQECQKKIVTLEEASRDLADLQERIDRWCEQSGYERDRVVTLVATPSDRIKEEEQLLDQITLSVKEAEIRLGERAKSLEEHLLEGRRKGLAVHPDKEHLEQALAEAEEALSRATEEQARLQTLIEADKEQRRRADELSQEAKALHEKYLLTAKLNDLLGSAQGDKYRKIAQTYTMDLLLHAANVHLYRFTKRYTLRRLNEEQLALSVVDHEMLDEHRSVLSLSGGESFLISLALALGLSTLSSSDIHLESMFIDEGFGTLDREVLARALDALQILQGEGRCIGIISHVADLQEEIPTRIQVVKKGNGRSSLTVVS